MTEAEAVSEATGRRIWKRPNLKPHPTETVKPSRDKRFVEKLHDIVAFYLNPPDRALVLCVDERSQIQALDRTQPGLPLKKGGAGRGPRYAPHKHPRVKSWLARHPRFQLHFTPTSSSWLKLVAQWFRDLTRNRIRRGSFENVPELIANIED